MAASKLKQQNVENYFFYNGIQRQGIINGSCLARQRSNATLSTSYQFGSVDRFAVKASGTAVSAGTIAWNSGSIASTQGNELAITGVTITGTPKLFMRYRMEYLDATTYVNNGKISFGLNIYQDTGATCTAVIRLNYANNGVNFNDFSVTSNAYTSSATSIPTGTRTEVKIENIDAISGGLGLEIEVELTCAGAITTKNFYFGDMHCNVGSVLLPMIVRPIAQELMLCQRYYEAIDLIGGIAITTGTVVTYGARFKVQKVKTPTLTSYSFDNTANAVSLYGNAATAVTGVTANGDQYGIRDVTKSAAFTNGSTYWFRFVGDAEL